MLGFAAATLFAAKAGRTAWLVFGAEALLYTEGHGIHLAANSVANTDPGETAHLWDEVVSHHLWYGGLAAVVAALAVELALEESTRHTVVARASRSLGSHGDDERGGGRDSRARAGNGRRFQSSGAGAPAGAEAPSS